MRTTLTLDPDVARLLTEEAHRQRKPFKQIVNEAIRKGLAPSTGETRQGLFRVRRHRTSLRSGIDVASFNKLADELEDDAVIEKLRAER
ncbi:MAG: antitoxin [bacterium]|nr:antitoxin [bacterium]